MRRKIISGRARPAPVIMMEPAHPEAVELDILPEELDLWEGVLDQVISDVVRHGKLRL